MELTLHNLMYEGKKRELCNPNYIPRLGCSNYMVKPQGQGYVTASFALNHGRIPTDTDLAHYFKPEPSSNYTMAYFKMSECRPMTEAEQLEYNEIMESQTNYMTALYDIEETNEIESR